MYVSLYISYCRYVLLIGLNPVAVVEKYIHNFIKKTKWVAWNFVMLEFRQYKTPVSMREVTKMCTY